MQEQYAKLKDHLYYLDSITCCCRRIHQFKQMEPGSDTIASRTSELAEACLKADILTKLAKSVLSNFKASATPQPS